MAYPNTQAKSLPEPVLCVRAINWPLRAPLMEVGGGAERREHGSPPLYQSDHSSPTHTKLTCRCSGHIQALKINHSGRELGTCRLHWMHHPSLCSPSWKYVCARVTVLMHSHPNNLHIHPITEKATFCDVITGQFSLHSFFNLFGSAVGCEVSATGN